MHACAGERRRVSRDNSIAHARNKDVHAAQIPDLPPRMQRRLVEERSPASGSQWKRTSVMLPSLLMRVKVLMELPLMLR